MYEAKAKSEFVKCHRKNNQYTSSRVQIQIKTELKSNFSKQVKANVFFYLEQAKYNFRRISRNRNHFTQSFIWTLYCDNLNIILDMFKKLTILLLPIQVAFQPL